MSVWSKGVYDLDWEEKEQLIQFMLHRTRLYEFIPVLHEKLPVIHHKLFTNGDGCDHCREIRGKK